ncbi:MAG: helix-turn-helix transcriptional regulator [Candidatus Levybacteria bacterium]|nr:helix-turn-helix transcriptional regulator [Candidatus Levybacteria bacterium]
MNKSIFTEDHKIIVSKLIKAREGAGLTQAEVAETLGKTQSYISKIESGQRRVDLVQLKEFAKIYKRKIEELI